MDEITTGDPLLAGHEIIIHSLRDSQKQTIRMTFRKVGEDTLLWPTGVGEGEFILRREAAGDLAPTRAARMGARSSRFAQG